MSNNGQSGSGGIKRRRLLEISSAAALSGLAGCGSGQDGETEATRMTDDTEATAEQEELGERVPEPLILRYWTALGGVTRIMENTVQILQANFEDALDMNVEIKPVEGLTAFGEILQDARTAHLDYGVNGNNPNRLDPHEMIRRNAADYAGNNGLPGPRNYASCEYSDLAVQQAEATSQEERRQLVYEAQSVLSNDKMNFVCVPNNVFFVVRTDEVNPQRLGNVGFVRTFPQPLIYSEPRNGDVIIKSARAESAATRNFLTAANAETVALWSQLPHSPLIGYNENYELENILAENYEVSNGGQEFTISLRDATFHNGDSVTAEHVKFTFELITENADVYPHGSNLPLDSIDIIDEKTIQFNTTQPFLPLISSTLPRWGILHQPTWEDAGVNDDPSQLEFDEYVGSGPMSVGNFEREQSITFEPHDGHPTFKPEHRLIFTVMPDPQTRVQALKSNEIHIATGLGPGLANQTAEEMGDIAEVVVQRGFLTLPLQPQFPMPPVKFREFRDAIGKSMDRQQINQVGLRGFGEADTYATIFGKPHPWRAPDDMLYQYTDDVSGDIDAAKQALEEAGWGWDGNGNLRYPAGADTTPRWPEGETPDPSEFACLGPEGNYVPPDER